MIFKTLGGKFFQLFFIAIFVTSGVAAEAKKPKMTPLELQSIQSREFEVPKDVAFNAVMTVVQDLGYIVQTADLPTGFITAVSPTQNKTNFLDALGGVSASGNTALTASLLPMPNGMTRVRLNFVNSKTSSGFYGQGARNDKPILDPAVYQIAWEKIDEALFVLSALSDTSRPTPKASQPATTAEPMVTAEPEAQ